MKPGSPAVARLLAGGAIVLVATGCSLFRPTPVARPHETPSQSGSAEPPQIVDSAASQPSAEPSGAASAGGMSAIERWATRMQQPPSNPAPSGPPAAPADATGEGGGADVTYEPIGTYRYTAVEDVAGEVPAQTEPPPARDDAPADAESPKAAPVEEPKASAVAAPVLRGISALPAPATRNAKRTPVTAPGAPPSAANAPAAAAGAAPSLQQMVDRWIAESPGGSFREQLDQRVLAVMAGRYDQARRPLQAVSREQQAMAARMVESLIAIRESHGAQPQEEADRVLRQLGELREALVPLSDLSIPALVLARSVRGFGNYEPFDPPEFVAGRRSEFVVYCEVRNFVAVASKSGGFESRFGMETRILTPSGDVALEMKDDAIIDRCRSRRHDCFISSLVRLPATLSPGGYVVKVTIVDKIGHKVAQKRVTFRIVARS